MIERFSVSGMSCSACVSAVERAVKKLNGVKKCEVNLLSKSMLVDFENNIVSADDICKAVISAGYGCSLISTENIKNSYDGNHNIDNSARRVILTSVCLAVLLVFNMFFKGITEDTNHIIQFFISTAVIVINRKFFIYGAKSLFHLSPNMDTLVSSGALVSYVYSIYVTFSSFFGKNIIGSKVYYMSIAMIFTFVGIGKYIEEITKSHTNDALESLKKLSPDKAFVFENNTEIEKRASELCVGDLIVIRPGQSIPCDGIIASGDGVLDESAVTGESMPVVKRKGDSVISATVNKNGSFTFKAVSVGSDTVFAKIIDAVNSAGASKAPIARLADKISGIFVPTVFLIAIITAIVWLVVTHDVGLAIKYAVSVLVISCPCSLGLATPVAIMVGTGVGAKSGIIFKSAESLENLNKSNIVVFDKTGTVTYGEPDVCDIIVLNDELTENQFLDYACAAESGSEHPIGQSIRKYHSSKYNITDFIAISGKGIKATVNNSEVIAGSPEYFSEYVDSRQYKDTISECSSGGKTPVFFLIDNVPAGIITVRDKVKQSSEYALSGLKIANKKVLLLSGDNRETCESVSKAIGADEFSHGVLPHEKMNYINSLINDGNYVTMVGDGINDAPALKEANIGIAMGTRTDIAAECSDIVLLHNDPVDVVNAFSLSSETMKRIKQNLFWAFFYNLAALPIAAGVFVPLFGISLTPAVSAAAMSLSSVTVVTNALRINKFRPVSFKKEGEEMEIVLNIEGMMCEHCVAHVKKALYDVSGVKSVLVNLSNGTAIAVCDAGVDKSELENAVVEAGYKIK